MLTMTIETPTITGESQIIHVSAIRADLFYEKLHKTNNKLAKQGLGQAKVLRHEMIDAIILVDGDETSAKVNYYTVEIPFCSKQIEGYTLVGTIEDLGADQRLMSAIVTGVENAPVFPQAARLEELYQVYMSSNELEDQTAIREYRTLRSAYEKFQRDEIYPVWEAAKATNATKLETLRTSPMGCIHCNTKRARKSVLVFEKTDKSMVMVGRQCAKEYFGVDLNAALQCATDLKEASYGQPRSFSANGFIRDFGLCYWLIKNFGYVSPKVQISYEDRMEFAPVGLPLHVRKSTKSMAYNIESELSKFTGVSREDLIRAMEIFQQCGADGYLKKASQELAVLA